MVKKIFKKIIKHVIVCGEGFKSHCVYRVLPWYLFVNEPDFFPLQCGHKNLGAACTRVLKLAEILT